MHFSISEQLSTEEYMTNDSREFYTEKDSAMQVLYINRDVNALQKQPFKEKSLISLNLFKLSYIKQKSLI